MQELFSVFIESSLSTERLEAYRRYPGERSFDALLRYLWNTELCTSFYPLLQHLEVALRNAMHTALSEKFETEWWFDTPGPLDSYQSNQIAKAKDKITRRAEKETPGKVVAELEFGFWTALLHPRYRNTLVPPLMKKAFSEVAQISRKAKRGFVSESLNEIRIFRNRIFHHEPVWYFEDLHKKHNLILQFILWLNPSLFKVTLLMDKFPEIYGAGTLPFKEPLLSLTTQGLFRR
ncbi:MAG: Abi family protein [Desulfovibrio sp.]|uniref:Abi family protein n=1 Tax=Desulfovibrio sp. 7SRBS1 TaxID=3378064 RepID=UPI003B41821D